MTEPIEKIVQKTIDNLNKKLGDATDLNEKQATAIIKECLDTAFLQASDEEHNTLYKKLSLVLHSDKFESLEKVKKSYTILNQLHIADLPFTELQKYQQPGFFSKITSSPVEGTLSLLRFIAGKFAKRSREYKRYPEPISTVVNIISWSINVVLISSLIALAVFAGITYLAITLFSKIQRSLINFLSSNHYNTEYSIQYNIELERLKNDPVAFNQEKHTVLVMFKEGHGLYVENMDSGELVDLYIMKQIQQKIQYHLNTQGYITGTDIKQYKQEAKDEFNNAIQSTVEKIAVKTANVTGFTHLAVICKAMFTAIAKPLPEGIGSKLAAIFMIKPFQVLATPVVFIGAFAIELARWGNTLVIIGGIGTFAALNAASLFVLTLPLYLLDAIRFIFNKITALFSAKPTEEEKGNQKNSAPTPSTQPESKPGVDSEPGNFSNPLNTATPTSKKSPGLQPEDMTVTFS